MKRIKILFSTFFSVICVILCFALVGCAKEGSLVENSLDYSFYVYNSLKEIDLRYSFDVTIPSKTKYNVEYTLIVYNNGKAIQTIEKSTTVSATSEDTVNVYGSCDDEINYFYGATENNLSLEVTNISVTPKEQSDKYQNYAIGFGTVGAAALIACTVLFIVFKQKEKK